MLRLLQRKWIQNKTKLFVEKYRKQNKFFAANIFVELKIQCTTHNFIGVDAPL